MVGSPTGGSIPDFGFGGDFGVDAHLLFQGLFVLLASKLPERRYFVFEVMSMRKYVLIVFRQLEWKAIAAIEILVLWGSGAFVIRRIGSHPSGIPNFNSVVVGFFQVIGITGLRVIAIMMNSGIEVVLVAGGEVRDNIIRVDDAVRVRQQFVEFLWQFSVSDPWFAKRDQPNVGSVSVFVQDTLQSSQCSQRSAKWVTGESDIVILENNEIYSCSMLTELQWLFIADSLHGIKKHLPLLYDEFQHCSWTQWFREKNLKPKLWISFLTFKSPLSLFLIDCFFMTQWIKVALEFWLNLVQFSNTLTKQTENQSATSW